MTRSTNMEHVEVLRHMKETIKAIMPSEVAALDAAIASLSAPQPPAEAQPAGNPNGWRDRYMRLIDAFDRYATPWMRDDGEGGFAGTLSRMAEAAAEAQPEPNWCRTCGRRPHDPVATLCPDTHHRKASPPSAPVGVEGWRVVPVEDDPDMLAVETPDGRTWFAKRGDRVFELAEALALARQPAPVGVPVDVVREYLDARACYEAATRPPNSHARAPVLKHDDPDALRLREARVALDNAIVLAQQPAAVGEVAELVGLLDEVRAHFARDDDLPDDLLPRIDAALAAQQGGSDNDR